MLKIVLVTVVVAILAGVGFYIWYSNSKTEQTQAPTDVTLQIWSMEENAETLKPAMDAYTAAHPNVKFAYKYQPSVNYTSRALAQIQAGSGPDILMINNSWLPLFNQKRLLAPLPGGEAVNKEYVGSFFPVVNGSFSKDGNVYGGANGVDGLVMFVNTTLLKEVGMRVPVDWREFEDVALKLTKRDDKGKILQGGAAIGLTSNVTYWSEILGLLFLQQPGANLADPATGNGPEVLRFYTGFATDPTRQIWSGDFPSDLDAFLAGKVGIIFGQIETINQIRVKNPNLRFSTYPMPQLSGRSGGDVNWANFYGWGVVGNSPHINEAWDFLNFMTSAAMEKELFLSTLQSTKEVGQVYSRPDIGKELENDSKLGAFLKQGGSYNFWYLQTGVEDKELNDKIIPLYKRAVDQVLIGEDPTRALLPIKDGVTQTFTALGWQP